MNTTTVQAVVAAAQRLSPTEQFEVIQALTRSLQQCSISSDSAIVEPLSTMPLPPTIRRTLPVTDIARFVADFWPEDETADDINSYIAQQRAADRTRDSMDYQFRLKTLG